MEALKTRLLALLGALAMLGWGLFLWSVRRPIPAPTERVLTKIEYRDRIVNKIVEQTKTSPDGTVVKTVVREQSKETLAARSEQSVKPRLDKYSLGLGVRADLARPLAAPVYRLEIGRRLGETSVWGTLGIEYQQHSESAPDEYSVLVGLLYRW